MATGTLGHSTSRLFFVLERITHLRYLVGTGAEVSTIPPTKLDRQRGPAGLSLQAANDTQIPTLGPALSLLIWDFVVHSAGYLS